MQKQHSFLYTLGFSAAVCIVCSFFVSGSAVALKSKQAENIALDKQKNVLLAAGLVGAKQKVSADEIAKLFGGVTAVIVDLASGQETDDDPTGFDQLKATKDPATSAEAPENKAGIQRLPKQALVYKVVENGAVQMVIIPIEGKGLWSTLYGFLALDTDGNTIKGITFYQHGETPGLGGEVDNPRWKAGWIGRKAYDDAWRPAIKVIKGAAGPAESAPHSIDGLSGATLTARGVTYLVQFWLGENGFGPYLKNIRE